jgi:hypothetical protein
VRKYISEKKKSFQKARKISEGKEIFFHSKKIGGLKLPPKLSSSKKLKLVQEDALNYLSKSTIHHQANFCQESLRGLQVLQKQLQKVARIEC